MAKPNIIIREIKKNIKVTELNKDEVEETEEQNKSESLEDLTMEESSPGNLSQFNTLSNDTRIIPQQIEDIPNETAEEEKKEKEKKEQGPIYQVQNVTEEQIRRVYETREDSARQSSNRIMNLALTPTRQQQDFSFRNKEVEAIRGENQEQENYSFVKPEEKPQQRRKMPWE